MSYSANNSDAINQNLESSRMNDLIFANDYLIFLNSHVSNPSVLCQRQLVNQWSMDWPTKN